MHEKVIVPLDGSPLAEVALPYAEEIAGKMGSNVILFTVLPSEDAEEQQSHETYITKMVNVTKRHMAKYREKSKSAEIRVGTATRIGNPAEGILDYAHAAHPCLIVMATHGRSGIGRWAVGSVADKVVRSTMRQPLLLIRAKGSHSDIRAKRILKKVLVPLDGSKESEAVLPYISDVASQLQMEIVLLRVLPKMNNTYATTETYLQELCNQLTENGISAGYVIRIGAAADQIIDLADEIASDMVAMTTHGQTAVNIWTLGSVAQKVLLGGNTPLLLIKT